MNTQVGRREVGLFTVKHNLQRGKNKENMKREAEVKDYRVSDKMIKWLPKSGHFDTPAFF